MSKINKTDEEGRALISKVIDILNDDLERGTECADHALCMTLVAAGIAAQAGMSHSEFLDMASHMYRDIHGDLVRMGEIPDESDNQTNKVNYAYH